MARVSQILGQALARLPDDDQLIFHLLIWENMSVAEVARAPSLP
jgi:DNA-directed RNA polymerase specialized sigma24 family protein